MSDTDFVSISKSLARRYKNTQQFDDLVSEGVLACYEAVAAGKTEHAEFVGVARRAMNDYINVKTKAVYIPTGANAKAVSYAMSSDEDVSSISGMTEGTLLSFLQAMNNTTESAGDDTSFTVDHADLFEEKEYQLYVLSVARKRLSATEWKVIEMRYLRGMTQDEVSNTFNTSKMWVSRLEKDALGKLRRILL